MVISNPYRQVVTRPSIATMLTVPGSVMLPGAEDVMKMNNAGGMAYKINPWTQLDRFLILGSVGGTFYVSERNLTKQNIDVVRQLIKDDGVRVVDRAAEISDSGRSSKSDPALFVLAVAIAEGDKATKHAVIEQLPRAARIGTHLFTFVQYATQLRGWGRVLREAVSNWYTSKSARDLAYQVIKYQSREGWAHRDVLRLSHAHTSDAQLQEVLRWVVKGWESVGNDPHTDPALQQIWAFERAKNASNAADIVSLIREYNLPRECIPTSYLKNVDIWAALLERMPITALTRNLATMSRIGLLTPNGSEMAHVVKMLTNEYAITKSRIHPMQLLSALRVYDSGGTMMGMRSQGESFKVLAPVSEALENAFYTSFGNVPASGKRLLLALDVSGSMGSPVGNGAPGLTCRDASAVMAMVTKRSESAGKNPHVDTMAFSTYFSEFPLRSTDSLKTVISNMDTMSFGGTDCSLPLKHALQSKTPVDAFVVYTDSETWSNRTHIVPLLQQYRQKMSIDARFVVVGMNSTDISIADPRLDYMLDVVGFDTATPNIIRGFSSGEF